MDFVRMGATEAEWSRYMTYVEAVRKKLPKEVYEFIHAPWHYDFSFHQCPHDAWLEEILIREEAGGERLEIRNTRIEIRLLGSFHDGFIIIRYSGVRQYAFQGGLVPLISGAPKSWHGNWLIDEVRVSKSGNVLHEIAFDSGASLIVECDTFCTSTTIPDAREDL